ncbi:ribonuclease P [Salinigranum rubrum]|uniref:Ribonuclease P protein component 2 n=1 Tax=Salinigranum rubrum TaxID=755307 RepID=A0A2I8VHP1_9EURY|nr:Rpp14/Pop5 family protein [Salinigranum rubrum]AUV81441.1 ribonuclease P [Salinigranum rubrum]
MKHLPKHLRPRWRYLAVELEGWPDASLSRGAFQREVWYAAQNLVGDVASADADLTVLGFEFHQGRGETLVRARRDEVGVARAVLACVDSVDGHPLGIRVRGVSGTVRAAEERYLNRRPGNPEERTVVADGDARSAVARPPVVDVADPGGFTGTTELDFE